VFPPRKPRGYRKLLVVDQDVRLLSSCRDLLAPYGFEVLTATDGDAARPIVEQNPDIMLVIVELVMPRTDGRQWVRWYQSVRKDAPVIVISSEHLAVDEDLQATAVLTKPFHVADLLDMVGLFCGLGTPTAMGGV